MVVSQLRRRGGRTVALFLAILIASAGFTLLTSATEANRLQTVGTVQAKARTTYDVLVRPTSARSGVEQSQGLIQSGFLTGIYGGITLEQWQRIKSLPGVAVAAPVAMVGYVVPRLELSISMLAALPRTGAGVARVDVNWSFDDGLSHEQQSPDFAYLTAHPLRINYGSRVGSAYYVEKASGTNPRPVCPYLDDPSTSTVGTRPSRLNCFSRTEGGTATGVNWPAGLVGCQISYPLPIAIAAVDPVEEDRLDGLSGAVTSGSSLLGAPLLDDRTMSKQVVPVLGDDAPATGVTATVTVSRVAGGALSVVQHGGTADALRGQPLVKLSESTITAAQAYRLLLQDLKDPKPDKRSRGDDGLAGNIYDYATVSLPQFDGGAVLIPSAPSADATGPSDSPPDLTPGFADRHQRTISRTRRFGDIPGAYPTPATMLLRGTFDPARLRGLSDLTAQILSGYTPAPTVGGDARSKKLLGDKALAPAPNVAGLVQPPPLMITTLKALPQLTQGWNPSPNAAPISAVRVRVAGVTGVDPVSRERVRVTAQRIAETTGLDVDVTVGSSVSAKMIDLAAGTLGRPELRLSQFWVKKVVAVAILKALDKKSLFLFALVLLVCALSVANSAVASVRTRRTELGVLACVGWTRRHLFTIVLAELGAIALLAGLAATATALALGRLFGASVSWQRALLALPAALLVALVAGFIPAWLAARADPMHAVRPAVHQPARARAATSLSQLGLLNLTRTRARAVIAAVGLAVAVQARTADYAATGATLLLAGLGVANVLYLNIRDRGSEIATLQAVGWTERQVATLVIVEGLGIGLAGALPGALLGLAAAAGLAGELSTGIAFAALLAVLAGLGITAVASALPVRMLARLPTAMLLTEQ